MQAVLLTMLALTGAELSRASADSYYPAAAEAACSCASDSGAAGSCAASGCSSSKADRAAAKRAAHAAEHERRHMMPQTCYAPRYGCYYGGDRHMHRYPAFHGTYYRRPYNYRNLFDYPWHAALHEPTSLYSYNVDATTVPSEGVWSVDPPAPPAPPVPPRDSASLRGGSRLFVGDISQAPPLAPGNRRGGR